MLTTKVAEYAASPLCPTPVVIAVVAGVIVMAAVFMALTVAIFIFAESRMRKNLQEEVAEKLVKSAYQRAESEIDFLKEQLAGADSPNVAWDDEMAQDAGRDDIRDAAVRREKRLNERLKGIKSA